jgi:hypothetical protein
MDISQLKMKDLGEVETLTGLNMDEWDSGSKVKLTIAIALVMGRKSQPDLTWEQVGDMSIDEMNALAGEDSPKATVS